MEGWAREMVVVVVVVFALGAATGGVNGQPPAPPSCINDLISCSDVITNTTMNPGSDCCGALKKAMSEKLACLCNIYNTPSIFETFNVNRTRALEIPRLCGLADHLSRCNAAIPPASSGLPKPSPGSDKLPKNGVSRFTWSLKACTALFALWTALVA